eukprot:SAG31_NODE_19556_length_599_cov_0.422000_1_plen_61_part_10
MAVFLAAPQELKLSDVVDETDQLRTTACVVECRADRLMRTHQTLDYVKRMETKYKSFDHAE